MSEISKELFDKSEKLWTERIYQLIEKAIRLDTKGYMEARDKLVKDILDLESSLQKTAVHYEKEIDRLKDMITKGKKNE